MQLQKGYERLKIVAEWWEVRSLVEFDASNKPIDLWVSLKDVKHALDTATQPTAFMQTLLRNDRELSGGRKLSEKRTLSLKTPSGEQPAMYVRAHSAILIAQKTRRNQNYAKKLIDRLVIELRILEIDLEGLGEYI